jgi:hypothetical protein
MPLEERDSTYQDFNISEQSIASKSPKMKDRRLVTKVKFKGSQMQNRVQEDLI